MGTAWLACYGNASTYTHNTPHCTIQTAAMAEKRRMAVIAIEKAPTRRGMQTETP